MRVSITLFSIIFLFYLIPFQDLIVSFLFQKGAPIFLLKFLLLLKEFVVIILGTFFFIQTKFSKARLALAALLIYVFFSVLISPVPIVSKLVGLRTYLLLFFSFILGERLASISTTEAYLTFYKHLKYVFFLVVAFSFLEYFILPMSIWKSPFPVMEMKREVANLSTSNEFRDWGIPVNAFGELTRRMLGPFDEPLYTAYFTVIIANFFIAQFFFTRKRPFKKSLLATLVILLTQTRAIILGLILSIGALIFKSNRIKLAHVYVMLGILIFGIGFAFFYHEWVSALVSSIFDRQGRNIGHINAYLTGVQLLAQHPFGQGVGVASSAVVASETTRATENAFINTGLEIGFFGIIWMISFLLFLFIRFKRYLKVQSENSTEPSYQTVAAGYMLVAQFTFAGLVAPHILTARILIPFMIVAGLCYGITSAISRVSIDKK